MRVNCVNPTLVLTEMGKKYANESDAGSHLKERAPQKKYACTYILNTICYKSHLNRVFYRSNVSTIDEFGFRSRCN